MIRNLAIVPARAGSKGVPGKNLKTLQGKTLVHRAIESALAAEFFDEVVLTTDIPMLLEEKDTRWLVYRRETELAQDHTPMSDVVLDVLKALNVPDQAWVWLLQPTSPFRVVGHFKQIRETLRLQSPGSVIGVTHVGDSHPSRHYKLSTFQDLVPLFPKLSSFDNRQNLKPVFERNGLYYVTKAADLRRTKTFYVPKCKPFLVDRLHSININDEFDYKFAQAALQWM